MAESTIKDQWDEEVANADLLVDDGPTEGAETGSDGKAPKKEKGPIESSADYEVAAEAESAQLGDDPPSFGDIAAASFGPVPEAIIGTDDRVQITRTHKYPWRAHASLSVTAADGSQWIGTAWFISPRVLVTAGHVVFINNSPVSERNGWVRSIEVSPGRDGNDRPYGPVRSSRFYSVRGWTENADSEYDYGAIVLSEPLGAQTGWFGFGAYSTNTIEGAVGNISGYPGDKPAGTQWYHARRITDATARRVHYDADTAPGQSGSAVYRIKNGQRHAMAVHAYGGVTSNWGVRITRPVFDNLKEWKDRHPAP